MTVITTITLIRLVIVVTVLLLIVVVVVLVIFTVRVRLHFHSIKCTVNYIIIIISKDTIYTYKQCYMYAKHT